MFGLAEDIQQGKISISNLHLRDVEDITMNEETVNTFFKELYESGDGDYSFEGDKEMKVYKFILSTRCSYFYQYFSLEKQPMIELNKETLKGFITWCYTNKIEMEMKECLELLHFIQKNWINEPISSIFYCIIKRIKNDFESNIYDNWALVEEFFLNEAHRRYYEEYFKSISQICLKEIINKKDYSFVGKLLPYILLSMNKHIEIIKEKKNIEKKKKTKKNITKPIETDLTVTLLHQEKKPKKLNTKELLETNVHKEKKLSKKDTSNGIEDELLISSNRFDTQFPLNSQNTSLINKLLSSLLRNKASFAFKEPVDPQLTGAINYFDIIKHPMDLGTIKNKLKDKTYKNVNEILSDIDLVWNNAFKYNAPNSEVWNLAKTMSDAYEKKLSTMKFSI
ncbi:hypothetical protein ENUP19_0324G0006 [Entamoeba nuttalli]|uniref:Bromodomain containing protein n=2 Tax=Entamoeba nuttalli TaxID=412467 RepID=K2GDV0_ENTNP|nr:bromodomain containing protein [Entamoeba nuttalli P19]EKE40731.1 bromodomain containing protein [Entamoeba nuttalli P19]|eukprot:XP_008856931.1 bromodomain containing protein [Entamoeba nuttalli P19]